MLIFNSPKSGAYLPSDLKSLSGAMSDKLFQGEPYPDPAFVKLVLHMHSKAISLREFPSYLTGVAFNLWNKLEGP